MRTKVIIFYFYYLLLPRQLLLFRHYDKIITKSLYKRTGFTPSQCNRTQTFDSVLSISIKLYSHILIIGYMVDCSNLWTNHVGDIWVSKLSESVNYLKNFNEPAANRIIYSIWDFQHFVYSTSFIIIAGSELIGISGFVEILNWDVLNWM